MSTLNIIVPQQVTSANVSASNVPETDAPAWSAATTYALGAQVIYVNKVYQSAIASNLNNTPGVDPTKWIRVRATNRHRCFDYGNASKTTQSTQITYALTTLGNYNAVCVLGLEGCSSVTVTLMDGATTVYTKTVLVGQYLASSSWWSWTFAHAAAGAPTQAIFTDLPIYPSATLNITINGGTALAVGEIVIGLQRLFGIGVEAGATSEIIDYSKIKENQFGDLELQQGAYASVVNFTVHVKQAQGDEMVRFLTALRATPAMYICTDAAGFERTRIFGIYQSWRDLIRSVNYSQSTIKVRSLV